MNDKTQPDKKGVFYVLLLVLIGLIITGFFLYRYQERNHELELHKRLLIERLASAVTEYKTLKTENDSLQRVIETDRNRIMTLMDSVTYVTWDSRDRLRTFEETFTDMRKQLITYRIQVDSLRNANDSLSRANLTMQMETSRLADTNQKLQGAIQKNAGLKINAFRINAINTKWSGRSEVTTDNYWTDYLKACYTLSENTLAQPGERELYLRIINPDKTIMKSAEDSAYFEAGGEKRYYTTVKNFVYRGEVIDDCIEVYRDHFGQGEYTIEVYLEGKLQVSTRLILD